MNPLPPVSNSKSGNIRGANYDPLTQTLRVEYSGGRQYDYHNVSQDVATAFTESPSAGEYLANVIKPACPASRVREH